MRHAVTHGIRFNGPNPSHKPEGLEQIKQIPPIEGVSQVIVGTGVRHMEIYQVMAGRQFDLNCPIWRSPFVGSADAIDGKEIVLPDSARCPVDQYIGLVEGRAYWAAFSPWGFVGGTKEGTLFLTGAEFLMSLGVTKPEKGRLYEIDAENRTVTLR